MPRPVHYVAATRGGLFFDCYRAELARWIAANAEHRRAQERAVAESPRDAMGNPAVRPWDVKKPRGAAPRPLGHTDLLRVTCRECWRAIARMAQERE